MSTIRKYGNPPYRVVLIHGGPGAAGEMASVARILSKYTGIVEPFNVARTIEGQLSEITECVSQYCPDPPVIVGFSWGALLALILAAKKICPVKKLVLIGCPPLEQKYADSIALTRLTRMDNMLRDEFESLLGRLQNYNNAEGKEILNRVGQILQKVDQYEPMEEEENVEADFEVFDSVWKEASVLRHKGLLQQMVKEISCPVAVIHGDYDPHPAAGIDIPLSQLDNYEFTIIGNCGHKPWIEKKAQSLFYEVLLKYTELSC